MEEESGRWTLMAMPMCSCVENGLCRRRDSFTSISRRALSLFCAMQQLFLHTRHHLLYTLCVAVGICGALCGSRIQNENSKRSNQIEVIRMHAYFTRRNSKRPGKQFHLLRNGETWAMWFETNALIIQGLLEFLAWNQIWTFNRWKTSGWWKFASRKWFPAPLAGKNAIRDIPAKRFKWYKNTRIASPNRSAYSPTH